MPLPGTAPGRSMCGIYGELAHFSDEGPPADPGRLARAAASLRHRGPDATGTRELRGQGWVAGLAHARLKVIDLSERAAQPMEAGGGRFHLSFNGEIYNYQQLKAELSRGGETFESASDTEVLLKALVRWGEAAIPMLEGMFAFAFVDARDGSMLAARDAFGIKPLYYSQTPSGVTVASEVRAFLETGRVPFEIDPAGVASYLAFGSVYGPGTIIRDIDELPPGHRLKVSRSGLEVSRWHFLPSRPRPLQVSATEAALVVRERLKSAVSQQLVSDVPIGVFLSGGMDSAALVALAAETHGRSISALTVALEEGTRGSSEDSRASQLASSMGVRHEVVRLGESWVRSSLDRVIAAMDQPTIDGANTWAISEVARAQGLTVALSGLGGDEIFGGYPHLRAAHHARVGWAVLRRGGAVTRGLGVLARHLGGGGIRARKVAAILRRTATPQAAYAVRRALFLPEDARGLATEEVDSVWLQMGLEGFLADGSPGSGLAAGEETRLEIQNYLSYTLLRDTDVMSMAHGLEVRVPFLDKALVDFVLGLDPTIRFDRRAQKPLLRAAIPEAFSQRAVPKQGFTLPFVKWLRGPMATAIGDTLGALDHAKRYVQRPAVVDLWAEFSRGGDDRLWTRVWALYVLERWMAVLAGRLRSRQA